MRLRKPAAGDPGGPGGPEDGPASADGAAQAGRAAPADRDARAEKSAGATARGTATTHGAATARGTATTPAPAAGGPPAGRAARRPMLAAALALVLAAAVAAVWTGCSWYAAAHDGDTAFARTRDTVLAAGEQAVQNLNTLDHSDLDHGLDVWEAGTTGDLHSQLVQGRTDFEKQVRQAGTVTTAKVLSGAVTELDTRAGRASVMIALRITVEAPGSKPSVKESRMLGELTRTGTGWKLSALGQAPLGDSSPAAAQGGVTDPGTGSATAGGSGGGTRPSGAAAPDGSAIATPGGR